MTFSIFCFCLKLYPNLSNTQSITIIILPSIFVNKYLYYFNINILIIIGVSLFGGIIIGLISAILLIKDNNYELNKELDKFRKLYFNEIDKWKDKYTNDNHELY